MKNAVIFFAHCFPSGLVYHLVLLGIELERVFQENEQTDFFVCSHSKEQYEGSWAFLRSKVPEAKLFSINNYNSDVCETIISLLKKYDRVLIHFGGGHNQLKPFVKLRRQYPTRLVFIATTHSFRLDSWKRIPVSLTQYLLYRRFVDHIVFQSPFTARKFVGGSWLLSHNRASIIPLGVEPFPNEINTTSLDQPLSKPDIREVLTDPTLFKFVYLAQFRSGKKHQWLVNALAPILRENKDVRVLFLGKGSTYPAVKNLIDRLSLDEQIVCPGSVQRKNIPWVLVQCQAAIVASRSETFGHCYLEPGMAGIPIIGTRVGVGEFLIQDMQTGIGFSLRDVARFRSAVSYFITHPDDAKKMGACLKSMVENLFTHASIAKAHARLYSELLRADRAGVPPKSGFVAIE
jgi:glycosyltransferase involved in cell wall biosynthesis